MFSDLSASILEGDLDLAWRRVDPLNALRPFPRYTPLMTCGMIPDDAEALLVAQMLIKRGDNDNERSENEPSRSKAEQSERGDTIPRCRPIHIAAMQGKADLLLFLENGASTKDHTIRQTTPLHLAARSGSPGAARCISILLEAGADVNTVDT